MNALAIDPRRPHVLYAATGDGVFKSRDAGDSWFGASSGLCNSHCPWVSQLVIDPNTPGLLYARVRGDLYVSRDAARRWDLVETEPDWFGVGSLTVHPWSPSTLYSVSWAGMYELSLPGCDASHHCFDRDRFAVEAVWRDFSGGSGIARAAPAATRDSGVLWFFDDDNWEMLVKVLDGCALNDRYWVFAAATTNVEYALRVTDTETGEVKSYFNPLGSSAAAVTDTVAFATCGGAAEPSTIAAGSVSKILEPGPAPRLLEAPPRLLDAPPRLLEASRTLAKAAHDGPCVPSPNHLCLNEERFLVELEWRDFAGQEGRGRVVPAGTDDSGLLWFFDEDNWEMLVKVLDGCELNDRFWVFAAATTNVEYTLRVTDTVTGRVSAYFNPLGHAAAAITDTSTLDVCGIQ